MVILEFMDMKSTKFGGLERFMAKLMERMFNDEFHFVYQNYPESSEMMSLYNNLGAHIHVIDTEGKKAVSKIPAVYRLFKEIKPDIIHFHFANGFFFFAPIAKLLGIKRLYKTQHCCLTKDDLSQVNHKREFSLKTKIASWNGKIYKLFDRIIMCGKYVENQFCKVYGPSDKYEMIYFGTEPINLLPVSERHQLREDLNIQDSDVVIATIAFADPVKGVDVLIRALSYIESDNYVVLLIGLDDSLELTQQYHHMAEEEYVDQHIRWIGITNEVYKYLSIADVYCQPSRSEALTLAVCEAKSAHLPVVGSNVGGLPEISNLVFEVGNVKQLSDVLSCLIKDEKMRHLLADKSYEDYIQTFSIEKGVNDYCQLYKESF